MRKVVVSIVLMLLLAAAISAAEGPIDQGSIMVGGEFGFNSAGGELYDNDDGDNLTAFVFNPSLAFFVAPLIAIGGEGTYFRQSQGDFSSWQFYIGPTFTGFFNLDPTRTEITGTIYPYVQIFAKYGKLTLDRDRVTAIYLGAKAGAMFMATDHWVLNANVFHQSETYKLVDAPMGTDDSVSGNTMGLHVGLTAFCF